MKGATLLTTLYNLGIVRSNSRLRVSNDNPYIESLFRTVNYYNLEHRHSGLKYITPEQRHKGDYERILENRKAFLESAREKKSRKMEKRYSKL
jgi:putative transposase